MTSSGKQLADLEILGNLFGKGGVETAGENVVGRVVPGEGVVRFPSTVADIGEEVGNDIMNSSDVLSGEAAVGIQDGGGQVSGGGKVR